MDNPNLEDIKNNPGKDPIDELKKSIAVYNKELRRIKKFGYGT